MCRIEQGRENYITKQKHYFFGIASTAVEIGEDLLSCRVDNFEMIAKTPEYNNLNSVAAARAHAEHRLSCQHYAWSYKGFLFAGSQIKIIQTISSRTSGVPGLARSMN